MASIDKNAHPATRHALRATVSFATLGCKTNQFESASMQESLQSAGYHVVPFDEGADLVIVNTCTVTNATDAQSRNLIRRARKINDACRVVVTGCYAQVDPESLQEAEGKHCLSSIRPGYHHYQPLYTARIAHHVPHRL